MRRKRVLSPVEINKINLMYHLNGRKVSEISRVLGSSAPVIERNIFPSRVAYEVWHESAVRKGEL